MQVILTTNRLILRTFELSDAQNMWALNDDPEVLKHTGDQPFLSVEDARKFLDNYDTYQKNELLSAKAFSGGRFGRWAVLKKSNNEFIGWCGLKRNEANEVDIGFRFFKKEWNKGYATEAAQGCLDFGFNKLRLEEIIGRAAKENLASIRVLEKLNMQFWKEDTYEGIHNALYYKLNKMQYLENQF